MNFCQSKVLRLIFFFFLFSLGLQAQVNDPYYIQYSIDDGLPSTEVYDLEIDSLQQIWFSTDRGVCVYNGYEFKTYTTDHGLAGNCNFEIYKDSKNRMWFTGYNQTISIFKNGQFYPYKFNESIQDISSINSNKWVENIVENDQEELFFCIGGSSDLKTFLNVFKLNTTSPPVKVDFNQKEDSLRNTIILPGNFYKFNGLTLSFYVDEMVHTDFGLDNKTHWLYFNNNLLFEKDKSTSELLNYKLPSSIDKLYVDNLNNLWVCTKKGIFYFENADITQSPKHYFKEFSISSIVQDLEGNYWLSSNESGILFVPSFDIRVNNNKDYIEDDFNYLSIGTLDNHIVIGTSNLGLLVIDKELNEDYFSISKKIKGLQVRNLEKSNARNQLHFGKSITISEVNEDEVKINRNDSKYNYYRFKELQNKDVFIWSILGFWIQNTNDDSKKNVIGFREIFNKKITEVVQDLEGTIWVGTINGLYKIKNNEYDKIQEVFYENTSFPRISDLKIDHRGDLLVGTIGSGIYFFSNGAVRNISTSDGLSSNMINQIFVSPDSNVWVANNKGINTFNYFLKNDSLELNEIKTLNNFDGLISNYVNDIDYWQGEIWAATNDGVCSFNPEITQKQYPEVPVSINQFVVGDSTFSVSDNQELKYFENDVFIEYTGVRYRKTEDASYYKYRLIHSQSNSGNEWFITNENKIRYNDLRPGDYKFEITAKNKIGQWNASPETLQFSIKPHFTDTSWFIFLMTLLVVLLLFSIIYFQFQRYNKREQEQKKRKEMELKSQTIELANLRNQMNPHFVFNSLNSIQNFIYKKDVTKANYFLSKFSRLMRDSLQFTSMEFIPLTSEINFLQNYLELEAMRFPDKFEYSFEIDKDVEIDGMVIPPLLFQPILENAVKHAFDDISYKGKIKIEIWESQNDLLLIQLSDNGRGIKERTDEQSENKDDHKSLGLEIITNRINLMNKSQYQDKAEVEFENLFLGDKGFRVRIYLPVKFADD